MIENNNNKETKQSYSTMLYHLVQKFYEQLPEELSFEKALEIGVDAWNLANNKEFLLNKNLYEKELKSHKNHVIINEMVSYKLENFSEYNNIILDFTWDNNKLQVKSQTLENRFNSLIAKMVSTNNKKN